MLANQRGFDTKILASYEILDYCKYLFDAEGFYRKSPKSELVINNFNSGTNTREDVLNLQTLKIYIVDGMALFHRMQLKNSTRLVILLRHSSKEFIIFSCS